MQKMDMHHSKQQVKQPSQEKQKQPQMSRVAFRQEGTSQAMRSRVETVAQAVTPQGATTAGQPPLSDANSGPSKVGQPALHNTEVAQHTDVVVAMPQMELVAQSLIAETAAVNQSASQDVVAVVVE
ncbi:OLC1v1031909C1 [Oldenlandia corymbosa var. corymbosa]|uniref:OLC1v1031909C1 n=1 Tax=Oldenlandia corymbosa var. corymbosa TaxID=529605 RepID=A0AAV1CJQ3_OLDCO|nr:OLC1v1031909C1 [Oldenlandia corymbosa var. corymbosa]